MPRGEPGDGLHCEERLLQARRAHHRRHQPQRVNKQQSERIKEGSVTAVPLRRKRATGGVFGGRTPVQCLSACRRGGTSAAMNGLALLCVPR